MTKKHKRQLAKKIQSLGDEPRPGDSKLLRGFDGYRRADSVKYCVIFRTVSSVVILLFATLGNWNNEQLFKLSLRCQSLRCWLLLC